jgi:hypothetical protein
VTTAEAPAGSTENVAEGSLARGLGYAFVSSLLVWSGLLAVVLTLAFRV